MGAFALKVHEYCRLTGGSVTSWIRSHRRNDLVGGVYNSRHLDGLAVDLVYDVPAPNAAQRRAIAELLELTLIVETDHDHLQVPGRPPEDPGPSAPPPVEGRREWPAAPGPKRS